MSTTLEVTSMTQPTTKQMTNQQLHPHTIIEVQTMVRELIKNKVCELESQSDDAHANGFNEQARQIVHAARELQFMQHQIFMLLHEVWDESCTTVIAEHEGHIATPQLPQVTPVSPVEVISD